MKQKGKIIALVLDGVLIGTLVGLVATGLVLVEPKIQELAKLKERDQNWATIYQELSNKTIQTEQKLFLLNDKWVEKINDLNDSLQTALQHYQYCENAIICAENEKQGMV